MNSPRYAVIGTREVLRGIYKGWERVTEGAKTAQEADILYDLMLEDESMVGPVEVIDVASGKRIRHSLDVNEQPLSK